MLRVLSVDTGRRACDVPQPCCIVSLRQRFDEDTFAGQKRQPNSSLFTEQQDR